jgi:hypothetical protein
MDQKDGITSQLYELNRETSEEAKKRFAQGEAFSFFSLLFLPVLVFLRELILKGKFSQGTSGMVESLLLAYRHFLIQGKLWELETKPQKNYEEWK